MVRPSKTTLILTFRYKHNILRHIDLELAVTRASSRWYSVTTIFMASGHSNLVPWPQVVLHFSVQGKRPRKKKTLAWVDFHLKDGWMAMFNWSLKVMFTQGELSAWGKVLEHFTSVFDRCLSVLVKFLILFYLQLASRTLEVTLWSENKTKRNVFLGEVRIATNPLKAILSLLTIT